MTGRVESAAGGGGLARATDDQLLDAFASRTAHALGTGVGVAGGYATLLRERHGAQLDADGVEVLSALESGLGRLRLFVDDLLELSGVGGRALRCERVDAGAVVAAVARDLGEPLHAASVAVEIGSLPPVVADPALLERAFHHLLRSAAAAIGRGPGRISVTGVRHDAGVRLEVSDDGSPLPAASAEALFEPFGPPRGAGALVGAGVSMAICRRIAERHGGSVSARGGERRGATVAVVLPEAA
jgi:signal transduction histidine kinase